MEALMKEYASDPSDNEGSDSDDKDKDSGSNGTQQEKQTHYKETTEVHAVDPESMGNKKIGSASLKGTGDDSYRIDSIEGDLNVNDNTRSKPVVDFFGLSNVETEDEFDNVEHESPSKKVDISSQGTVIPVEIPGSEFWTGVETSELQKYQDSKTERQRHGNEFVAQRKRNFPHIEHEPKHSGSANIYGSRVKLKESNPSKAIQSRRNTSSFNPSTSSQHPSQTRKLYFVHPKISPLLHNRQQSCRVPSKVDWKGQGHGGAVNRVKWNVPSYSHLFVTCSMDSTIKIWNIWSQLDPCVKLLSQHSKAVRDVEWSQDGRSLLSCSYDKTAAVTDVEKGNPVCKFDHTSYVSCGKWHPTNPSLCVTGGHNQRQAWDTRTPDVTVRCFDYKDNFGQVQDILFVPDGSSFFSSSDLVSRDSADRNLMAWDFRTGVTLSNQIYQERYTISRLKLHPYDGNFLAQSNGNYIAIFSTTRPYKMNRQKRFEGHKLLGYSLGFDITPDGSTVVSGSSDGKIYCYNYQTGKQFRTINTDMDVVMDTSFHPLLSTTLVCCAWDGSVQVWK